MLHICMAVIEDSNEKQKAINHKHITTFQENLQEKNFFQVRAHDYMYVNDSVGHFKGGLDN